jgi:hypothetical protein
MPMISRLIVLVSLMVSFFLGVESARALDLVNIVLAPLPPFIIEGGVLGTPPGIVTEILTEAYRREGKQPYYAYMPAARAEHTVRNGRALATVVSGDPKDQSGDFVLSNSLLRTPIGAFVASSYSGPPLTSFKAIAERQAAIHRAGEGRLRVISIHGDQVMDELREAGVEVEEVPGVESALALVGRAEGRVVLVTFSIAAVYTTKTSGLSVSQLDTFTIGYSDFYLAISRSRPGAVEMANRFNRVLETLRLDGTVRSILTRYGITQATPDLEPVTN